MSNNYNVKKYPNNSNGSNSSIQDINGRTKGHSIGNQYNVYKRGY